MSVDQPLDARSAPRTERRAEGKLPVFAARPGGAAERFAHAMGSRHPALVFFLALLGGFLLLLVASILLGLLIVHVLASGSGLGLAGEDQSFVEELVGIGAILLLLFACRAASAAAERRSRS